MASQNQKIVKMSDIDAQFSDEPQNNSKVIKMSDIDAHFQDGDSTPLTTSQKIYGALKLGPAVAEKMIDSSPLGTIGLNPLKNVRNFVSGMAGGIDKPVQNAIDYEVQKSIGLDPKSYEDVKAQNAELYPNSIPSELMGAMSPASLPSKIFEAADAINPIQETARNPKMLNLLRKVITGVNGGAALGAINSADELAQGNFDKTNIGESALAGGVTPVALEGLTALGEKAAPGVKTLGAKVFNNGLNVPKKILKNDPNLLQDIVDQGNWGRMGTISDKAEMASDQADNSLQQILETAPQNQGGAIVPKDYDSFRKDLLDYNLRDFNSQTGATKTHVFQPGWRSPEEDEIKQLYTQYLNQPDLKLPDNPHYKINAEDVASNFLGDQAAASKYSTEKDSVMTNAKKIADNFLSLGEKTTPEISVGDGAENTEIFLPDANKIKREIGKQAGAKAFDDAATTLTKEQKANLYLKLKDSIENEADNIGKDTGQPDLGQKVKGINRQLHINRTIQNAADENITNKAIRGGLTKSDFLIGGISPKAFVAKKIFEGVGDSSLTGAGVLINNFGNLLKEMPNLSPHKLLILVNEGLKQKNQLSNSMKGFYKNQE